MLRHANWGTKLLRNAFERQGDFMILFGSTDENDGTRMSQPLETEAWNIGREFGVWGKQQVVEDRSEA